MGLRAIIRSLSCFIAWVCFWLPVHAQTIHYRLTVHPGDTTGYDVEMRLQHVPHRFKLAMATHHEYDDHFWRYLRNFHVEAAGGGVHAAGGDAKGGHVAAGGVHATGGDATDGHAAGGDVAGGYAADGDAAGGHATAVRTDSAVYDISIPGDQAVITYRIQLPPHRFAHQPFLSRNGGLAGDIHSFRSEERRVGKECVP